MGASDCGERGIPLLGLVLGSVDIQNCKIEDRREKEPRMRAGRRAEEVRFPFANDVNLVCWFENLVTG